MEKEKKTEETVQADMAQEWMKLKLKTPVEYQGIKVDQLDLSGMEDLTGRDLNSVYDLYANMGGSGIIMQEATLLFAQLITSKVTGLPLELFYVLRASDSVKLKNRVYRFFFLEG
ncbi:phage tail assembly protein [Lacrimispora sp.]|uniref:phage tail assembly protein n=1 Tax=Lacrimispora sp. TaxID=2719234 RepID=UPI0028AB4F20|nr:phage tail assembly protein [Lacrimispora sp.]